MTSNRSINQLHLTIVAFVLGLAVTLACAPQAFAATYDVSMKAGSYKLAISNADAYEDLNVTSSNASVCTYDGAGYLYSSKPGSATLTATRTATNGTLVKDTYRVTVNGYVSLPTAECDDLVQGRTYSFQGLFFDHDTDLTTCGTFVKGVGYKVKNSGKSVKFTKKGKVTVKYKVSGKTYDIVLAKVHGTSNIKAAAKKCYKQLPKYKKSGKVKKIAYRWDFGTEIRVTYQYKTTAGKTATITKTAIFCDGTFTIID